MEMMAVMVIVVMMSALAIPAFRGFYDKTREDAITGQICRLLRYAHQKAVYRSQITTVTIDFEEKKYWVFVPKDEEDRFSEEKRELETSLPREFTFSSVYYPATEDKEDRRRANIRFFPDGTAQGARIVMTSQNNEKSPLKTHVVMVRANTGRIRVVLLKDDERVEEIR